MDFDQAVSELGVEVSYLSAMENPMSLVPTDMSFVATYTLMKQFPKYGVNIVLLHQMLVEELLGMNETPGIFRENTKFV